MNVSNKAPFVFCCITLIFTTIAYGGVHQPVIAIYYLLVVLAGCLWVYDGVKRGDVRIPRESLLLPLAAAAFYALIQVTPLGFYGAGSNLERIPLTISLDPFATWNAAYQLIALLIFFGVLLSTFESVARIRRFVTILGIFGFAFAFFSILQNVVSPHKIYGIYDVSNGDPFGSFVNRNNFAAYIMMISALPLGSVFLGVVAKDKRLLYITAIVLMGAALLLSGSRGGLVAFIAQVALLFFMTRRSDTKKEIFLRVASIVLLIVAIIAGSVFVGGDTSLTRLAETAASEDFSTQRSHIWSVTTRVIAEHLPLGTGFGAFAVAYTQFDEASGLARVEQAHNDYLQVIADAGIPGLLVGLAFLYLFLRKGRDAAKVGNSYRRGIATGAFAGCFAVLVQSIFDFVLHITAVSLLFVSLLALLSASCRDHEDDIEEERENRHRKRRRRSSNSTELARSD